MSNDILTISANNFDLTESIKEAVVAKMNKVLSHDKDITSLDIVLTQEHHKDNKGNMQVKANIHFHKNHIHHEVKGEDMYAMINEMSDHLLREIRK